VSVAFNVKNTSRAKRNKIEELMVWIFSEDVWIGENMFNSDWISEKQLFFLHLPQKVKKKGPKNLEESTHSEARPELEDISVFCKASQRGFASGKAKHEVDHVS
jgi:hypothetical protein